MAISSEVMRSLIPGALGLAGTLISIVFSWAKELNASAQRMRALDEATRRTAFWDAWLKAHLATSEANEDVEMLKSRVRAELSAAASPVEEAYRQRAALVHPGNVDRAAYQDFRRSLSRSRRWLLLYKPPRALAWVPRLFFYGSLVEALAIPFTLIDPAERQDWQYGVIGILFLLVMFRALSIWAEKPTAVRSTA